jgi:hypothetical protein
MPGRNDFVLTNESGWIKYSPDAIDLPKELWKKNLIRSEYVLAVKGA